MQPSRQESDLRFDWAGQESVLPEVTLRMGEWLLYCPPVLRARIADCTATMADRMAGWAERNWVMRNSKDLDMYSFAVAGSVGLALCEIWEWFEGVKTDRGLAVAFGRGLQAVNMLRNVDEDS